MDISTINKQKIISRWKKSREQESKLIKYDNKSMIYRAAICGFLAGDGSVQIRKSPSRYDICFFPDDKKMLQTYLRMIKYVYGRQPSVKTQRGFYSVRFTSTIVAKDILQYCNFGIKTWTLPTQLFSLKGAKEEWLKAFFSAEGYVSDRAIRVQTVNTKGIASISSILNTLKIQHRCYMYKPKNQMHSVVAILAILKKSEIRKFYNKIGFYHEKKENIIKKLLL